jgi:ABC-type multidrug transport system fused ATPase/permease subunit
MTASLKQYWDLLAHHIRPQRGQFTLLVVLMLSGIGLQLVNPQIMRRFIDAALSGSGSESGLLWTAAAFIAIALVQQVVAVGMTYLGESVAWTATNALRAELAWHCLNLDMSFHNNHTPGELIERIDGDVAELKNFFSQFVVALIGNGLLLAGILIVLFFEDWRVGLAFTLFAGLSLAIMMRLRDIAVQDQKDSREAQAGLFGFIEEQLTGTEDVRSSGAVDYSLRELTRLQGSILKAEKRAHFKIWILNNATGGALTFANILAVTAGYLLFTNGMVTIGTAYLFVHYMNMLENPLWALTRQIESFQKIGACVQRLNELRRIQSKVKDSSASLPLATGALGLRFEDVSFAYQDGKVNGNSKLNGSSQPVTAAEPASPNKNGHKKAPAVTALQPETGYAQNKPGSTPALVEGETPVLHDLSFALAPGRVLGLLGHTGSGKTTLTRLVFRMFDPSAGRILLGETDLRDAGLEELRQRVGVVTQDVQLFRASVRDNLTFFDSSISDSQILAAIEALGLQGWYRSLPDGLDTSLDSGGHSLSAGEGQLLALTRIFLRSPGLVILDEASSRLDPATEQHIERALDRLLHERTAIIIAHRLGTVQRADDILILKDGRVVEFGRREALARDPDSHFASLLRTGLEEVLV